MELKDIHYTENVDETLRVLNGQGLLISTVSADGRPNIMTIGWAQPGILWGRKVFVVYVRPSRYTFTMLEQVDEFVVNVPGEDLQQECMLCGTKSGRDVDKFAECGFTAVAAQHVKPPLIGECVRFYECRTIHHGDLRDSELPAQVRKQLYPAGDIHRVYYGEILRAAERA